MSLEISTQLIPLRAMAHPLRLRILSMCAGAAMSASELAEELRIAHAAASYHARQLADAGLLQAEDDSPPKRAGPGRPPVRYRYVASHSDDLDRSDAQEALWDATSRDISRRLHERSRHRIGADAEVWMTREDFEIVCALAEQIADLVHERALSPRAEDAVRGSVSVFAFELDTRR